MSKETMSRSPEARTLDWATWIVIGHLVALGGSVALAVVAGDAGLPMETQRQLAGAATAEVFLNIAAVLNFQNRVNDLQQS